MQTSGDKLFVFSDPTVADHAVAERRGANGCTGGISARWRSRGSQPAGGSQGGEVSNHWGPISHGSPMASPPQAAGAWTRHCLPNPTRPTPQPETAHWRADAARLRLSAPAPRSRSRSRPTQQSGVAFWKFPPIRFRAAEDFPFSRPPTNQTQASSPWATAASASDHNSRLACAAPPPPPPQPEEEEVEEKEAVVWRGWRRAAGERPRCRPSWARRTRWWTTRPRTPSWRGRRRGPASSSPTRQSSAGICSPSTSSTTISPASCGS